jgi:hypothetical protein
MRLKNLAANGVLNPFEQAFCFGLDFYNRRRPHSSLDGATPDQAYFTALPLREAA